MYVLNKSNQEVTCAFSSYLPCHCTCLGFFSSFYCYLFLLPVSFYTLALNPSLFILEAISPVAVMYSIIED